jgi:tRNA(Ile)-lysidine synthase
LENIDFTGIELAREAIIRERPANLKLDLGDMIKLVREYETVILSLDRGESPKDYDRQVAEDAETILIPSAGAEFIFLRREADSVPMKACGEDQAEHAVFDADLIAFPLRIRNRRSGDRIRVLGLNGSKKVKDIFIDDKIPPSRRNIQPHLVDANGRILWIPGLRRSDYAMVTGQTKRLLHVSVTFFIK